MYIYLSKILPLLVMPVGLVIGLLLVAYILMRRGKAGYARGVVGFAIIFLWLASMPIVGDMMLRQLENDFPAVPLELVPPAKCVVLLGGTLQPVITPRVDVNMLDGIDRVHKAAQLYKADKAGVIIVSGGNQPWTPLAEPESRSIKKVLMTWGVPNRAIHPEDKSRNTYENVLNIRDMLAELECGVPLLVTSAAHMKRAVGAFNTFEVEVHPVSADVRAISNPNLTILDFIPSVAGLTKTSDAFREWIGRVVYRYQGWN